MPYITTAELAERPGARELALAASSDTAPVVAYALMDATLRGADRSAWTTEQVVAADAALTEASADLDLVVEAYRRVEQGQSDALLQRGRERPARDLSDHLTGERLTLEHPAHPHVRAGNAAVECEQSAQTS